MATKQFNARQIQKHDTEANWDLTSGFIPFDGEIIIYDKDSTHDKPRMKVGDGVTDVKLLPFASGAVESVNNKTGVVTLTASDVGADPSGSASTVQGNLNTHTGNTTVHTNSTEKAAWNAKYDKPSGGIPKTDLASGVQSSLDKADTALQLAPVTSVNTKTGAVTLGKSDVGLGNVDNVQQYSASNPPPYPVTSVNSKTGAVTLNASDVLPEVTEADNGKILGVVHGEWGITEDVGDVLPEVSTADNGKVLGVVNGVWVADDNDFVVTFKKTNNVWSADKTINEISEAISAHKYVYATARGRDVTSDSAISAFSLLIPVSGTSLSGYVFSASFKSTGSKMIAVTLTYLMNSITLYTGEYSSSAYIKPSSGIPSKDLASGVTDKLTEVIKYTIDPNTSTYVCNHTFSQISELIEMRKPFIVYVDGNIVNCAGYFYRTKIEYWKLTSLQFGNNSLYFPKFTHNADNSIVAGQQNVAIYPTQSAVNTYEAVTLIDNNVTLREIIDINSVLVSNNTLEIALSNGTVLSASLPDYPAINYIYLFDADHSVYNTALMTAFASWLSSAVSSQGTIVKASATEDCSDLVAEIATVTLQGSQAPLVFASDGTTVWSILMGSGAADATTSVPLSVSGTLVTDYEVSGVGTFHLSANIIFTATGVSVYGYAIAV